MQEFDLIRTLFAPLATDPGALGLMDDAAILSVSPGGDLVLTKDLIVAGTHYLSSDPAGDVAEKLLAVNLSDLAAKGADPRGCLLGLKLGDGTDEDWLRAFAAGLADGLKRHGLALLGGDTVSGAGPAVLSLTAFGEVPKGEMLRRGGAKPGDHVYVTGTLGDGALGLKCLLGELPADAFLISRYRRPQPRLTAGRALRRVAHAACDVSDGLLADLGHICAASGVGARIYFADLPLSAAAAALISENPALGACVYAGGDDYEILFTAPPGTRVAAGVPVTRIGEIVAGGGVALIGANGNEIEPATRGYVHKTG